MFINIVYSIVDWRPCMVISESKHLVYISFHRKTFSKQCWRRTGKELTSCMCITQSSGQDLQKGSRRGRKSL